VARHDPLVVQAPAQAVLVVDLYGTALVLEEFGG
jgi:hypothetical protein